MQHVTGNLVEHRSVAQLTSGQSVNARRSQISAWVDQSNELVTNRSIGAYSQDGDFDDAIMPLWEETRGFHVDDGEVVMVKKVCFHPRALPADWIRWPDCNASYRPGPEILGQWDVAFVVGLGRRVTPLGANG